jgi:catechol 2,3-dioxygenase-like lactoylglutathione lyase family enzyme
MTYIGLATLVVRDYDEAIAFYVDKVGFELAEDVTFPDGKRWVVVRPAGAETGLLLARADRPRQHRRVGNQTGGRVSLFLWADDFHATHQRMVAAGVAFMEEPRHEAYGWVCVWEDLYGNRWDLLEIAAS